LRRTQEVALEVDHRIDVLNEAVFLNPDAQPRRPQRA
jgi:hypothetical protein